MKRFIEKPVRTRFLFPRERISKKTSKCLVLKLKARNAVEQTRRAGAK